MPQHVVRDRLRPSRRIAEVLEEIAAATGLEVLNLPKEEEFLI